MKPNIHPENMDCVITCACGATFKTTSTKSRIGIDVCAKCHPFFTGEHWNRRLRQVPPVFHRGAESRC